MRWRRLCAAGVAGLFMLSGCVAPGGPGPDIAPPEALGAAPALGPTDSGCRIGPQDGPIGAPAQHAGAAEDGSFQVAENGIGGTGTGAGPLPPLTPATPPRPTAPVDRGLGGTGTGGMGGGSGQSGGTGIVGVITGFGSICVNGLAVAYGADTAIRGEDGSRPELRAGQLALIDADAAPGEDGLRARRVTLRDEVVGPIESVDTEGTMVVAGQIVRVSGQTRGDVLTVGDWAAVSGLRDADGGIAATRIDRAAPGLVRVHGLLAHDGRRARIGALLLHLPDGVESPPDGMVTATGRYLQGVLYARMLVPDLLPDDPSSAFGPETSHYVVETIGGFGAGVIGFAGGDGAFVVHLRRGGDGVLHSLSALRAPVGYAPLARGVAAPHMPGDRFRGHGFPTRPSLGRSERAGRYGPAPLPERGRLGGGGRGGIRGGERGGGMMRGGRGGGGGPGPGGPGQGGLFGAPGGGPGGGPGAGGPGGMPPPPPGH